MSAQAQRAQQHVLAFLTREPPDHQDEKKAEVAGIAKVRLPRRLRDSAVRHLLYRHPEPMLPQLPLGERRWTDHQLAAIVEPVDPEPVQPIAEALRANASVHQHVLRLDVKRGDDGEVLLSRLFEGHHRQPKGIL